MTETTRRFRIGAIDVVQVVDTILAFDPREVFPAAPPNHLPDFEPGPTERIQLPVLMYALVADGSTTVVDCGIGSDPPQIGAHGGVGVASLIAAGVDPATVDTVLYTHLHPDHIGGGVDQEGKLSFANATYVVAALEWEFWERDVWRTPEWAWLGESFERRLDPLVTTGQLQLVETDDQLGPRLRLRPLLGHTPGQVGLAVDTGAEPLMFIGDAVHHPAQWDHPEWGWESDADPARAVRTRESLLDQATTEDFIVATAHFPLPGIGQLSSQLGMPAWSPRHWRSL